MPRSTNNRNVDYEAFTKAFVEANPDLQKQSSWKKAKAVWTEVRPNKGNRDKFDQKMAELKHKAKSIKSKQMSFWVNLKEKSESIPKVETNEIQVSEDIEMKNSDEIIEVKDEETDNSKVF